MLDGTPDLISGIALVTGPLTLLAFLAVVFLFILARTDLLKFLNILDRVKLTRNQAYKLALTIVWLGFGLLAITIILVFVSYMIRGNDSGDQPTEVVEVPITPTSTPSFTPSQTPTSTPTPTVTMTPTPTFTLTPTPTATQELARYAITDCITSDIWRFFDHTAYVSRRLERPDCYDLSPWGMFANNHSIADETMGLLINLEAENPSTGGVYFVPTSEEEIHLTISMDRIEATEDCGEDDICDINLILGLGDPTYEAGGRFMILRITKADSAVLLCMLDSVYSYCGNPLIHIQNFDLQKKIRVQIHLNYNVLSFVLSGVQVEEVFIPPEVLRIIWIGYNFRASGLLRAFIDFHTQ